MIARQTNLKIGLVFAILGCLQWVYFLWGANPWLDIKYGFQAILGLVFIFSSICFLVAFLHFFEKLRWFYRIPLSAFLSLIVVFSLNIFSLFMLIILYG